MKNLKFYLVIFITFNYLISHSQGKTSASKIKISGTVIEKISKQPLEYATITFTNGTATKSIAGGITNPKGEFSIDVTPGTYTIKVEFISFKPIIIKDRQLLTKTNLGEIALTEDAAQLNEVIVRAEKTDVEIKLDKKVYSIGTDLMVKGGTVSDVLNNVPSVAVDIDGVISLRGNENVTIFIDGKPSNTVNINEALRLIPADAIDKVEVITNPSARYDAEGGAGILNIVLKKGKNQGFNGTVIGAIGYPENNSISGTLNYKIQKINFFTNQGYADRLSQGNGLFETNYFNPKPLSPNFIREIRSSADRSKSYNGNFGIDWSITDKASWINSVSYRKSKGNNTENVLFNNEFLDVSSNYLRTRISNENGNDEAVEYKSNFIQNFKKEGHKLNIDLQIASNNEFETANISDSENGTDLATINQKNDRELIQVDYVLPLGKNGQLETGYRGSFLEQVSDVNILNNGVTNINFSNKLEYLEKVHAFYTQYGLKINKFSYLFGLRWEDSNVNVNNITKNIFISKNYNNLFPSAFITYEFSKESSLSLNYSRRISRPRGRLINPISNYSSNISILQGNPNLNPAMTDAFDFGYLKKYSKLLLSTSLYTNRTTDSFLFVRIDSGEQVNGVPVIIATPINLAEIRTGFEFNLNYSPYKWWKLNSNFNFFKIDSKGAYTYTDFNNKVITLNFDQKASLWSTRLNSRVTLPYKIDMQSNMQYTGDQITKQGKIVGVATMNLAFSKDVLKDKGTIAFTISDVFNTRKFRFQTLIEEVANSNIVRQRNVRQFILSFTYRLNKSKSEKEKQPRREDEGGGDF